MSTSPCYSLYYTKADMERWRAFAIARGYVRKNGKPILGSAIKELISLGLEASLSADVAGNIRLGNEQTLKQLSEVLGLTRHLTLHLDKDGKVYTKGRETAQKLFTEAMLPLSPRR